jgi:hypothetical protein
MTARELIVYILENHLEDEPVFKNGTFIGFMSEADFAKELGFGVATIRTLFDLKMINGVKIGNELYIPVTQQIDIEERNK